MATAISFYCVGACPTRSRVLDAWFRACSRGKSDEISSVCRRKCAALRRTRARALGPGRKQGAGTEGVGLRRTRKGPGERAAEDESPRKGCRGGCRRRGAVRRTLRGMPRQPRHGRQEGAEPQGAGSTERHAGRDFLDPDQRRRAQENAGVVKIAGAAAVAIGELHQVARDRRGCERGSAEETLATVRETRPRSQAGQALNHRATGFHAWVWSQITRSAAVMGMARIRPMPPHTHPQKSKEIVMATAFSCTCRPTSCGAIRFCANT